MSRTISRMTLIYVGNSDGCIGRCDAHCYEAKEPHCQCICGGRNHGEGKEKAIENSRRDFEEILREHPEALPELSGDLLQQLFELL